MNTTTRVGRESRYLWIAIVLTLTAIAVLAPQASYLTDSDIYKQIGREVIIPDCSSLHCTRVLVPWLVERLPGSSLLKWKLYAVAGNLVAAAGVARVTAAVGLSPTAAPAAAAITAFGAGAQLTLFDPYTADPFIYAVAPWMVLALLRGRFAVAGLAAAVSVFAKEFAAAPLWIFVIFGCVARRRDVAIKSAFGASAATAVWVALQLWFILRYNYSFGGSASSQLLAGGDLAEWIRDLGPVRAAGTLVIRLAPLFVVAAAGFIDSPRVLRRLAVAAIPAAIALIYVQQPDRAVWNFNFILAPLAAGVLARCSLRLRLAFLTGFFLSSVHVGPRLTTLIEIPGWLIAVAATLAIIRARRRNVASVVSDIPELPPPGRVTFGVRLGAMVAAVCLLLSVALAADVAAHRRVERGTGVNIWGYSGPVLRGKQPDEMRIAILGGGVATGPTYERSLARSLENNLNTPFLRAGARFEARGPIAVVDLAAPCDGPATFNRTLRSYQHLRLDAACFYLGPDERCGPSKEWRRTSAVFRITGYLPMIPGLRPKNPSTGLPRVRDDEYLAVLDEAVRDALREHLRVVVATHPFLDGADAIRQDLVGDEMRRRFGSEDSFVYVDLRRAVTSNEDTTVISEKLSQSVFQILKR